MTFHREESWRVLLSASAAVAGIAGERCIVAPRRMWLVAAAMSSPFLSRFPFPSVSFTAFLPPGRLPAPPRRRRPRIVFFPAARMPGPRRSRLAAGPAAFGLRETGGVGVKSQLGNKLHNEHPF